MKQRWGKGGQEVLLWGEKNPFFLRLGQKVTDRDRGGVRRRCNRGDREWGRRRSREKGQAPG
jgi:hypothetical protein